MKHKLLLLFLFIISSVLSTNAQVVQTIRGKVFDAESKFPLAGANVILLSDTHNFTGVSTDENGAFRLENVTVGRHTLKITFLGYETALMSNIIVSSAKEVVLNINLKELVTEVGEVEITSGAKGEAKNEMATVSARQFSIEETERYAGSRGDPARMASNFAGVSGANDSRNDIIIRGNSPMGVLWRFEGIDIPNPNHFAVAGTSGGPTGIINNKYLANSDFYTGAFPAEFGNSLAGVFDLKMRAGNNEKHEFTGQVGVLGAELMAEGPINKKKGSSYMINYRYSTIMAFKALGIDVGTNSLVKYQDAGFKFNFPTKKGGAFSLFGIGGMSSIDIVISGQKPEDREIYGEKDRDQYFRTGMNVVGVSYSQPLNASTLINFTLAQTTERQRSLHQYIFYTRDSVGTYLKNDEGYYRYDSLTDILRYKFKQQKLSTAFSVNKKINSRHSFKTGLNADINFINLQDSLYMIQSTYTWNRRWAANDIGALIQPYFQWKYNASEKITFNAGIHNQFYTLNNSYSVLEPRAGMRWEISKKQNITLGTGVHSQLQPTYIYFYQKRTAAGNFVQHNRNIGMTKSAHIVLGYNRSIGKNMRFKAETYYQTLWNVPVEIRLSSFSLLNQGVGFARFFPDSLKNTGTGENYGVEFTVEKFFSNKFFFMITTSLYQSTFVGSDGVKRNTDFNGNYILNILGSKEITVRKKNAIVLGTKVTYAGNKRYGPADVTASNAALEIIYVDSLRNSLQFPPYFRWDIKLGYKVNNPKVTHEIAIDLVNILGTKNVLNLTYSPSLEDPNASPIVQDYQLGFLPIFYYRIDF